MGKWNFDYKRLSDLEKRMEQLENANKKLIAENEKLRAEKQEITEKEKKRAWLDIIRDEQYEFLFGDYCKNGKLAKTKERQILYRNFGNVIRNISFTLKPIIKKVAMKLTITYPALDDFDDYEWEVSKKTAAEILDYLAFGKNLMEQHSKGHDYDLSTAFEHQRVKTFAETFRVEKLPQIEKGEKSW